MTFHSGSLSRGIQSWRRSLFSFRPAHPRRMVIILLILAAALAPGEFGEITRASLIDAYIGVSVFVAATLILFYGAERLFRFDLGASLRRARWAQVPISSLLGALPGCGGAVVIVAAYSSGNVRMGAVVAALTATMGDAAFLLIATRPEAAAIVLPVSFVVGIISGYLVDLLTRTPLEAIPSETCALAPLIGRTRARDLVFTALTLPGFALGVMKLAQVDLDALLGSWLSVIALASIATGLFIRMISPVEAMTHEKDSPLTRMTEETSFITLWVIIAFLLYAYLENFAGLDLKALFATVGVLMPLVGILIGWIPGCGPQVFTTTLYINGVIPFSALIGNAISNDGDALFPAIALNPRAAVLATVYSTIPALFVSYGFYFFLPDPL